MSAAATAPATVTPPETVRNAYALWLTAVAAGAFETVLAVGRMTADGTGSAAGIAIGLAVRLTVFTAAVLIARRMRARPAGPGRPSRSASASSARRPWSSSPSATSSPAGRYRRRSAGPTPSTGSSAPAGPSTWPPSSPRWP